MRDYEKLAKRLLDFAAETRLDEDAQLGFEAADAIKELLITTSAQKETIGVLRARNSAQADMLDGEWISVEDAQPEKHETVLFYIPWNKSNMIGWYTEDGNINFVGYGKCYDFSLVKPSHWTPLPKPPKEVYDEV